MDYHTGSRSDRIDTVALIPEEKWSLDTMLDLLGGLWDHGWQVCDEAKEKLLRMACDPNLKPLVLHPKDLALRYIQPGTYDETFRLVKVMKQIGPSAKEVCVEFFKRMGSGSNEMISKSLEILKGSELEGAVKPIVDRIFAERKERR